MVRLRAISSFTSNLAKVFDDGKKGKKLEGPRPKKSKGLFKGQSIGSIYVKVQVIENLGPERMQINTRNEVDMMKLDVWVDGEVRYSCTVGYDEAHVDVRKAFELPVTKKALGARLEFVLTSYGTGTWLREGRTVLWSGPADGVRGAQAEHIDLDGGGGQLRAERVFMPLNDPIVHASWLQQQPESYLLCGKQSHVREVKRWVSLTQSNHLIVRDTPESPLIEHLVALAPESHLVVFHDNMLVVRYLQVTAATAADTFTQSKGRANSLVTWREHLETFAPRDATNVVMQSIRVAMVSQWQGKWDVVLTYDSEMGDSTVREGKTSGRGRVGGGSDLLLAKARANYVKRMRESGLIVVHQRSADGSFVMVKVAADDALLFRRADQDKIEVQLKRPGHTRKVRNRKSSIGRRRDSDSESKGCVSRACNAVTSCLCFPVNATIDVFNSTVAAVLGKNAIELGFDKFELSKKHLFKPSKPRFFNSMDRQRLILNIMTAPKFRGGADMVIQKLISSGVYTDVFPLHDEHDREELTRRWIHAPWYRIQQPIRLIRNYLGVKTSFYFAFLEFYTRWLFYLSVVGSVTFFVISGDGLNFNHPFVLFYSFLVVLWCALFIEFWKREESVLSLIFAMSDFETNERERPNFVGEKVHGRMTKAGLVRFEELGLGDRVKQFFSDPNTDFIEWTSPWTRIKAMALGAPVLVAFFTCCVISSLAIIMLRTTFQINEFTGGGYIGALPYALLIFILGNVYERLAVWLNEQENWRTPSEYETALIAKTFAFQAVNNYSGLFFIAFLKQRPLPEGVAELDYDARPDLFQYDLEFSFDWNESDTWYCYGKSCMGDLFEMLVMLVIVRTLGTNVLEICLPAIRNWFKFNTGKAVDKRVDICEFELQSELPKALTTFEDYLELMIQFGYVTLFAQAFPLASVAALANNLLEKHIDSHKRLFLHKREFYQGASSIGVWTSIIEIITFFSVTTNCALIAFTWVYVPASNVLAGTFVDVVNDESSYLACVQACESYTDTVESALNSTILVDGVFDGEASTRIWRNISYFVTDVTEANECLSSCTCDGACWSLARRIVFFIVAEHLVMLLKVAVDVIIPDTPTHVAKAIVWQEIIKESEAGEGGLLRGRSTVNGEELDDDALYATWSDEDEPDDDEIWDNERDSFEEMSVEKRKSIVKRHRGSASEASMRGSKDDRSMSRTFSGMETLDDEIL